MDVSLYGLCANSPSAKKQQELFRNLTILLMRGIIAPAEILLRSRFGERYFDGNVLAANLLVLLGATLILPGPLKPFIWVVFFILLTGMLFHQGVCFFRDRRGDYWHSYSDGKARFRIPPLERFMAKYNFFGDSAKMFIEPAVIFIFAIIIALPVSSEAVAQGGFDHLSNWAKLLSTLSTYYAWTSIALLIYQGMAWNIKKQAFLDAKDAQVTAQNAMESSTGQHAKKVASAKTTLVSAAPNLKVDWTV